MLLNYFSWDKFYNSKLVPSLCKKSFFLQGLPHSTLHYCLYPPTVRTLPLDSVLLYKAVPSILLGYSTDCQCGQNILVWLPLAFTPVLFGCLCQSQALELASTQTWSSLEFSSTLLAPFTSVSLLLHLRACFPTEDSPHLLPVLYCEKPACNPYPIPIH